MSLTSYKLNATLSAQLLKYSNDIYSPYFCSTAAYIRLVAVLLLRAGYVLIQIGSIPINDVYSLVLHNILDITVTVCAYGLMGHMFSNSDESLAGFMGTASTLSTVNPNLDSLIHGFTACLIGSAIITTMLAGRVLPMTIAATSFLHAGLVEPIVMHWVWHDRGWMARNRILNVKFSVKDYGGVLPVHLTSGLASLWGSVCLGRRLVKLKDVCGSSLGSASPGLTFTGYIFVFLGLTSFNLPTQKYEQERIPADFIGIIMTNSLMSLTSGLVIILLQCFCFGTVSGYWVLLKCLQGCLAGLITMSAGIDVYDHFVALFIGVVGTVIFYCVAIVVERMFYEDACNVVPIHVFCSLTGAFFPALLGNTENLGSSIPFSLRLHHTGWQVLCCIVVTIWTTAFFLPLFVFLQYVGLLATRSEELNHQRSLNVMKNVESRGRFWRIFSHNELAPFVEPGAGKKSGKTLDFLKKSGDSRRELLEAVLARSQEMKGTKEPTIITAPMVPVEKIVKGMGILESERYPASYEEDLEKRLATNKELYQTITEPMPINLQEPISQRAAGDYSHQKQVFQADVHDMSTVSGNKEVRPRKKILPRRRPHTVRRKKKVKRLDSDYSNSKSRNR